MNSLFFLLVFFFTTTLSHALFLLSRNKKLWLIHEFFNGILWLILILWVAVFQFASLNVQREIFEQLVGVLLLVLGSILVIKSYLLLGFKRAMGSRFFFKEKSERIKNSLYNSLNNPMYDGFVLIFVGLGLVLGITGDFYLAGASFVLLNIFLASIENYQKPKRLRSFI